MIKNVKDLMNSAKSLPSHKFERKLNHFVRTHHSYSNLDSKNRKLVNNIVGKYKDRLRHQGGISSYAIRKEMYRLSQKRHDLDLSREDLKDIKKMMEGLKK